MASQAQIQKTVSKLIELAHPTFVPYYRNEVQARGQGVIWLWWDVDNFPNPGQGDHEIDAQFLTRREFEDFMAKNGFIQRPGMADRFWDFDPAMTMLIVVATKVPNSTSEDLAILEVPLDAAPGALRHLLRS